MKRIIFLYLFILFICPSSLLFSNEKQLNITFVSPSGNDENFWGIAHNFARASAKDLGLNFEVLYVKESTRYTYLVALESAFKKIPKPDFVIAHFYNSIVSETLQLSKEYNIPLFMVNSDISKNEKNENYIRNIYPTFIGHMSPDEVHAGYILAKYLIKKQKLKNPNKTINVVGITGHRETTVTHERNEGLTKAAREENAIIKQIAFTNWSKEKSYALSKRLIFRNEALDVIWAASDLMSLSAKKAISENGKDSQIITGGIDWTKEAISKIKNGKLDASVGGHFSEIGFALVLLYDYTNGKDFYEELGGTIKTKMALLNKDNINKYYDLLTEQNWNRIDFSKYSKSLNPKLKKYDFSFGTLLK